MITVNMPRSTSAKLCGMCSEWAERGTCDLCHHKVTSLTSAMNHMHRHINPQWRFIIASKKSRWLKKYRCKSVGVSERSVPILRCHLCPMSFSHWNKLRQHSTNQHNASLKHVEKFCSSSIMPIAALSHRGEMERYDPMALLECGVDTHLVTVPDYEHMVNDSIHNYVDVLYKPTTHIPTYVKDVNGGEKVHNFDLEDSDPPTHLFFHDIPHQKKMLLNNNGVRKCGEGMFCAVCYRSFHKWHEYDAHVISGSKCEQIMPLLISLRCESNVPMDIGFEHRFPKFILNPDAEDLTCTRCNKTLFSSRSQFHEHLLECYCEAGRLRRLQDYNTRQQHQISLPPAKRRPTPKQQRKTSCDHTSHSVYYYSASTTPPDLGRPAGQNNRPKRTIRKCQSAVQLYNEQDDLPPVLTNESNEEEEF